MTAKTLDEVLTQTREFHHTLSQSLKSAASDSQDTRAQLLLDYLQAHEEKLSGMLKTMQDSAERKQLDTWFYDFTQQHHPVQVGPRQNVYSQMNTDDILSEVMEQHKQVVELYRYLYGRAGTSPARELLNELVELEQHEAMLLSQEGGRTQEM